MGNFKWDFEEEISSQMKHFPNRHWHVCNAGLKKRSHLEGPLSSTQPKSKGLSQENLDVCLREAESLIIKGEKSWCKMQQDEAESYLGKYSCTHTHTQREKQTHHMYCFCVCYEKDIKKERDKERQKRRQKQR